MTNLEQAAQAASELTELTARIASHPARRCLLLIDPVLRPLEAELEDGPWQHYGKLAHTSVAVTHPNVDASAYPVLTALRLDHEAERTLLGHSVQEAIAELQPEQLRKGRAAPQAALCGCGCTIRLCCGQCRDGCSPIRRLLCSARWAQRVVSIC